MRQADLNRAIAQATGESVSTIKRLGFLLAEPAHPSETVDPDPRLGHLSSTAGRVRTRSQTGSSSGSPSDANASRRSR